VKVPAEFKCIHVEDKDIASEIAAIEEKLNGKGRVLIRPSGTEPLVRIMLEGEVQEEIDAYANRIADIDKVKDNNLVN